MRHCINQKQQLIGLNALTFSCFGHRFVTNVTLYDTSTNESVCFITECRQSFSFLIFGGMTQALLRINDVECTCGKLEGPTKNKESLPSSDERTQRVIKNSFSVYCCFS